MRHLKPGELTPISELPGAAQAGLVAEELVQAALLRLAPGTMTPWHHHGEHHVVGYVVTGSLRVETGPQGATVIDAGPGDLVHAPPRAVHREGNVGGEAATIVMFRAGSGPGYVELDGAGGGQRG